MPALLLELFLDFLDKNRGVLLDTQMTGLMGKADKNRPHAWGIFNAPGAIGIPQARTLIFFRLPPPTPPSGFFEPCYFGTSSF